MKKIKVTIIAPYEGLVEITKRISPEFHKLSIDVHVADLQDSVPLLTSGIEADTDLFISRGGTANVIRTYTTKPVIEIPISGYDILRMILLFQAESDHTEIIAFENISHNFNKISELIQTTIPITAVTSAEQVEPAILQAKSIGRRIIVGDVITINLAKKHGLDGILITSGEESVHTALEQADLLGASMIQKDSNEALLQRAFEQSNEMFFIMNRNGHVLKKSPHFIHTYDQTTLERFIRKAKALLKQEISSTVILSKDAYIQLQIKPFTHENEKMIYVSILKTNQSNPLKIGQIQTKHLSLSFVLGRNEPLIQSFNEATNYKGILINGLEGSGEEVLAKALLPKHAQVIDALNLLEHSPIDYSTIPLFIRNIDALAETEQTHVLQTIEAFSEPVVIHSKFLLTTDDQLYPIQLPSLIEREKEWDQFVRKLIGEANQLYGKQVIGYRGELPEIALKRYEWLIEYVFSLVKSSIQPHITLSETSNHFISLHKSLEEIEKDIIKHVLAEEDFNQSKAAERLQINRTTLWRKLK
ncbi:transcriptional regulator with PAS, ATPase and Fis domain [Alkalihalobacillus xiaoxiensis]|uniref:Transcriptional regulator with PAS, ATPase and Fis domain n=1 Tax=Shouchella xiaoxiensis TaxID=766895 RepID=A0ABS2SVQ3_9BACI|nr:transcriptional regulator with PAS, ATPase and Fis domain [Shouchella xiaoxiensis]